ncbi:MAG TPA: ethylbenzene dehydrogenase-related protein [Candidatus Binatia bacterium]|nr:ethylbenzene dehydrogenase-related protein [Candidatus Binatia bacterium]
MRRTSALAVLLVLLTSAAAWAQAGDATAGKAVYERKCAGCHGDKGDGKGPAAELLLPRPRDFTRGLYKIRTTAGKTPSDQDLFKIITDGMPGTSMPSWAVLPDKDRWNLVAYIKTFAAEAFKEAPKKLELPKEVASSEASIKRGKEMFEAIECHKCHGTEGRADGPSRPELKDEWGFPVAPANLTKRWTFRGGAGRTEIATRLAGGVLGTPMPAFLDSVEKPEDIWHLTNFIASLGPEKPSYSTLITVTAVTEAIPDDPGAELWKKAAASTIPLMGQVIVDPRNFNPAVDLITIRAAYNDKDVAFHLTWDDPSESKGDGKQTFPDAVSLQFPPQITGGTERPYFLMGDASEAVYLLRWEQGKGVSEFSANGPAKIAPLPGGEASGKAVYANGQYHLVIKRPLAAKGEGRPAFQPAQFTPVAFQAWDGGAGETGTRMSLTSWYYLRLEEPQSNRRFVIPPVVAILTLAAMFLVVRAANRAR